MEQVRVGIIGVGSIATGVHIPQLLKVKEAKITAICDIDEAKLHKMGEELAIPAAQRYVDYMDLINDEEVDAVEVCTPNYLHVPISVAVLKAGKHLNVEKPLSIDYESVKPLEEALKECDLDKQIAMTCFSYRFRPAVRYAKWIIEQGMLGQIVNASVEYLKDSAFVAGRRLEWRFVKELAGTGVLGDLGVHLIDMTRLLLGDFKSLTGHTEILVKERLKPDGSEMGKVETDDYCSFIALLENDVTANFTISRCAIGEKNTIRYDIYGTEGVISFDLNNPDVLGVCVGKIDAEGNGMHTVQVPARFNVLQEQTFIDAILGEKKEYFPDVREAIECQKILSAIQKSDETKTWVTL